ncbi:MAG TPA: hypothetical protein PLX23_09895 [Candidatus Hydrogenedens sp.]|nr:hypothetical protein [Candidatus Hydrogenedens sp.]
MHTYPTITPEYLEQMGNSLTTLVNRLVEFFNNIFDVFGWDIRVLPWQ